MEEQKISVRGAGYDFINEAWMSFRISYRCFGTYPNMAISFRFILKRKEG